MVTTPSATEVRLLCFDFLVFIARAQYRDPLHLLLECITKVSATVSYHHLNYNVDGTARTRLPYGRRSR